MIAGSINQTLTSTRFRGQAAERRGFGKIIQLATVPLWKERDKAIKQKYDKLNNEVLPKVAHDKQARINIGMVIKSKLVLICKVV